MALRCMAQFVGGETNYSSWNVFQNTVEIYRGEGVAGFFRWIKKIQQQKKLSLINKQQKILIYMKHFSISSGLIPRLLFEASTIAIANTVAYLIKTYVFEEKEIDALIDLVASVNTQKSSKFSKRRHLKS
mgnify:CR=1 FL=1